MRKAFHVLAAVLIAGAASGVGAQSEHHGHHGMAHKTAAGVTLDVKQDAAAQVIALRLGPLNLPARTDHMATPQAPAQLWTLPADGWLVAYHPRLVDGTGNPVPGRVLHHVAFWNTGRPDFLCPNKEEHIFGAGGEMNDWPEVPGYGYRVAKGDRIRIETMFHNPTDVSYPQTYLEVRVEYRARGSAAAPAPKIISVYPAWFDVMQCGSSGYDLKPGENVTSGEITLKYGGALLGVGGHMHDYARRLVLVNLTRKEEIASLEAKLDPQGRILAMPIKTFYDPARSGAKPGEGAAGYRLNKGERIRVRAVYDNRAGQPLPDGAMGIVVGYFVPDDNAQLAALRRPTRTD